MPSPSSKQVCAAAVLTFVVCGHQSFSAGDEQTATTGLVSSTAAASADDETERTLVATVQSRPVQNVARTLENVFRNDLAVVADVESNVLILKGSQKTIDACVKLLKNLDQPPRTINIDVNISIIDAGDSEESQSNPKLLDQLQLTTLEEKETMLQFGQQVAVVSGTQQMGSRGVVRSYRSEQTGTMVKVNSKIMGDDVVMELQVEKSWIEFAKNGSDDDSESDPAAAPTTYTAVTDTTLHLKKGASQSVKARVSGGTPQGREVLFTLSATIGDRKGGSAAGATGRPTRSEQIARSRTRSGPPGPGGGFSRGGSRDSGGRTSSVRPSVEQSAQRLFERFDTNDDGKVDKEEWSNSSNFIPMLESRGVTVGGELDLKQFTEVWRKFMESGIGSRTSGSAGRPSGNPSTRQRPDQE